MRNKTYSILLVVLIAALIGLSALLTRGGSPSSADAPGIPFEAYTLPNGLDVILSRDERVPMVAVNLWYHVGPANEEPGRTGFAHLFEHMMFQSSKHVPPDAHFKLLEAAGASDVNGTTDFDRTNYFQTVPANQLELALWLESDRMGFLLEKVDQAMLSNQQDVVRNERRQSVENQPYGLAEEALVQALYPRGHPYYGNVIGSHEDIQAAKLDDVRTFFRQYYSPNNASLAIVGDFDPAQARSLVEKYFSTLKRGPDVPAITAETPKIGSERRKVVHARIELPRVYMAWLTSPIFTPGDAEAGLAATILGGRRSSRLYKKLVYDKQIAQTVSAQQYSLILGSIFQIEATARPGHTVEELERALEEELAAFRASPPTPEELERARNTIETNIVGGLEFLGGFGGKADRLNSYNHYLGTPDYLRQDIERYRTADLASIHAFAREQLTTDARAVIHVLPGEPDTGTPVPTPPAPQGVQAVGESINADEPWRSSAPAAVPERPLQLPTPASATLPNGLTLILSERRQLPIVAASLVLRTGGDANPLDRPGTASFVSAMLLEGTSSRSSMQLADEVAGLGASLGAGSSMDATTVTARSLTKNFAATLGLLADVVLNPSFPAEEVERQRASRLATLVQARDDPAQVAALTMAAALYGFQHPYGYNDTGTEASVKALTRDEMAAFWKQNFVPNDAALVVAGDISMSELRALADKAFGTWQRGTPTRPSLGAPTTTPARVVIVDKPGSPQTMVRVGRIGAARSSPDFRPVQVMNMALGGLFSSRINMNLREQHGYTYGAYSEFSFRRTPGPFQIQSGIRTDVTGPAVSETFAEIRGMTDRPVSDDELKKAKDSLAHSLPGAFESNANAVSNFSNVFIYDLGLDYYSRYAEQVNAVTADQTLEMARKYMVPGEMVVVAVGDRAKIEPGLKKLNLGPIEIRTAAGSLQRTAGSGQ